MPVFISVIIPTYNRASLLSKCILALKENYLNFKYFEIIICDSNSKDATKIKIKNLKSKYFFLNIKYFNIKKNLHSAKRNKGLAESVGKFKIFLDDDCIPEKNFIRNFYSTLSQNSHKHFYCGSVDYKNSEDLKKFLRYRKSRHFNLNKKSEVNKKAKELSPATIVTMNMGFDSRIVKLIKPFFDERFNLYGFEDFEFGYRLRKHNIKIIACKSLVYHHDFRPFKLYLNKLKFLGRNSMMYLEKINFDAAKSNNFYKLQNNLVIKILLKFNFFYKFLRYMEKTVLFWDSKLFYLPIVYKISFIIAYLQGCYLRKISKINNISVVENSLWYK